MPVTYLAGRHARVDVSLDGIRFTRSETDAARRGTERVLDIGWDEVTGAHLESSGKGRLIMRITVSGAPADGPHREDPHALKVPRKMTESAHALVEEINVEVETRQRWRRLAPEQAPAEPSSPHQP